MRQLDLIAKDKTAIRWRQSCTEETMRNYRTRFPLVPDSHFNRVPKSRHLEREESKLARTAPDSVEREGHCVGVNNGEPLTLAMDALARYARAYYEGTDGVDRLTSDSVLGPAWLAAIVNVRKLLNGNGAVAMANRWTTDTKSNGILEAVFWSALADAGYSQDDV